MKFFSQLSSHWKRDVFLSKPIMGFIFSTIFGMNRDNTINLPINLCTSLTFLRLYILVIAWHLSGLASMPQCVNMKPKNLSPSTPNTHLSRFNHISTTLNTPNTFYKSCTWFSQDLDFTTISLTYTSTLHPIRLLNTLFISRWYVNPVFFNLKGITS